MAVLRAAYVEVKPKTDGFDAELKKRLQRIDASAQGRRIGDTLAKGLTAKSSAFATALATTAARMTLVGSAAAAAAPGVAQLTAALAPAAGAATVLPAALLAVKAASATVKVALVGVGDAISAGFTGNAEQAAEALGKLHGSARVFASEVIRLRPQVEGLQRSVSSRFFKPLADDVRPLAQQYLPMLRQRMSDLAGTLGGVGEQFAQSARRGVVFQAVSTLLDQTANATVRLRGAVGPLMTAFAALIQATAPQLPKIADGFTDMATNVAAFITTAAQSGRIIEVYENAKETLRTLGGILGNIGSIFSSVTGAAQSSSAGLLTNVLDLTGAVADFFRTAQGGSALTAVFSTLGGLGDALKTALGAVLPAIADSVQALAPAVSGLAPALAGLVVAVAPLLPYFAQLAATVITKVTPAVAGLAEWMSRNSDALKVAVGVIGGYIVAQKAAAAVTAVQAAILAVQGADGLAAYLKGTMLVRAATAVWTGVQWALNAALTANPIGLVIAAVAALGVAVVVAYQKSETFRSIVQAAWQGIQTAVSVAWNNVIKPAVAALVTFFRTVIAPTAMWLYNNVFKPAFAGISTAVKVAWVLIQIQLKALQMYLTTVIIPVIRFLYNNVVKPVFSLIAAAISAWWNYYAKPVFNAAKTAFQQVGAVLSAVWTTVIKPMFAQFSTFLTKTVAPAFRSGVDAISKHWDALKRSARQPVEFVVRQVINPLVRGINDVAGFVGVKDRIPEIPGFARGGQIPGAPSLRDNLLARGPAGPLAVASGEFITNTRSTLANLPALRRINSLGRTATMRDLVDVVPDGRAHGGMVGDGIGDFFSGLARGAKGLGDMVTDPKKALTRVAEAALSRIPGGGPFVGLLRGMGERLVRGVGSFLGSKLGGGIGGAGIAGGWRGMQAAIARQFPGLGLISGFRPGAVTVTGNASYHGKGRAVDYPPVHALAAWIKSTYGAKTKELITPWQDLNILNGRPHRYTGRVWDTHNFAGGNAHVHWAAALGGLVGRNSGMPFGSYDSGGYLPPGLSLAHNGTGRPEPVGHHLGGGDIHLHFHGPVASKQAAEDMVVAAIESAKKKRRL